MRLFLFLLIFCSTTVFAQDTTIKSFKLHSTILNEDRYFNIYIPSSSTGRLEVIYILDGQAHFTNVINTLKSLGQNQKIVVGIGNIWQRDRDYTPTHVNPSPFLDSMAAVVSGGGPKFISHIKKELIPYIDSHYPTDKSRILIGHSLGGLIAIDFLLNHSDLFHKYVVIDPAMWWDDSRLAKQSEKLLGKAFHHTSLFLAIANTRNKDKDDIEEIRKDTTGNTALIRPSLLLLGYLQANLKNNSKLDWKYYKHHDHMSVPQPALYDGLKFLK